MCIRWLICFLGCVFYIGGCALRHPASSVYSPTRSIYSFTAEAELTPFVDQKVEAFHHAPVRYIDQWAMQSSAGTSVGTETAPDTPWSAVLTETDYAADVRATRGMTCVAEEWGRFYLEHDAVPDRELGRFIAARCGAPLINIGFTYRTHRARRKLSEQRAVAVFGKPLLAELNRSLTHSPHVAGIWYGRSRGRAVVMAVFARAVVEVPPTSAVSDADRWTFRGRLQGGFHHLKAMATAGPIDYAPCRDEQAVLPDFEFSCPLAVDDSQTRIELTAFHKGAAIGMTLAGVLIHQGDEKSLNFERAVKRDADESDAVTPSQRNEAEASEQAERGSQFLLAVNRLRQSARLPTLEHIAQQSRQHSHLIGALCRATLGQDSDAAHRIASGLSAGYRIPGPIRSAEFYYDHLLASVELQRWLSLAMQSPTGRSAVMSADARYLSVGVTAITGDSEGLGAVVTVYRPFSEAATEKFAETFFETLNDQRKAAGLPPARLRPLSKWDRTVELLNAGQEPASAFDSALKEQGRRVVLDKSFHFESGAAELTKFPHALLTTKKLDVALSVGHHRPASAAWGQYSVFLATLR